MPNYLRIACPWLSFGQTVFSPSRHAYALPLAHTAFSVPEGPGLARGNAAAILFSVAACAAKRRGKQSRSSPVALWSSHDGHLPTDSTSFDTRAAARAALHQHRESKQGVHAAERRLQKEAEDDSEQKMVEAELSPSSTIYLDPKNTVDAFIDVVELARKAVQRFVEGPGSYPIVRRLESVQANSCEELLVPDDAEADESLTPKTWADGVLDPAEAHRLFYKLSLGGHCSEVTYVYLMVLYGYGHRFAYSGECIETVHLCVGFVKHDFPKISLGGDFGINYWQHSTQVHCGARNHIWVEFSTRTNGSMILDLTALQFDIIQCKEDAMKDTYVQVGPASDQRYRACYKIPATSFPIHFRNWAKMRFLSAARAMYLARTLLQDLTDTAYDSPRCFCPVEHDVEQHVITYAQQVYGMTEEQIEELESKAVLTMNAELGQTNPYSRS